MRINSLAQFQHGSYQIPPVFEPIFYFMKLIPLTQGQFAMVDDEDFEKVNQFKWIADKGRATYYAKRRKGKTAKEIMHRFIMNVSSNLIHIDHKDHNGLNNQKENLRECSPHQNSMNTQIRNNKASQYKGVSIAKHKGKKGQVYIYYVSRIRFNNKSIRLGYFNSEIEAAIAYNNAAIKYFGEYAFLNLV